MKYYTAELWAKNNSLIEKERDEAEIEWYKNAMLYHEIFQKVKLRLPKKFLDIWLDNHGFHDFQLRDLKISHKDNWHKKPVSIAIFITNGIDTYKITYKCISSFQIDFEENKGLTKGRGFDDWGYDEFLAIDNQTLSHEILFASGSTIKIYFKNKNIFVNKI